MTLQEARTVIDLFDQVDHSEIEAFKVINTVLGMVEETPQTKEASAKTKEPAKVKKTDKKIVKQPRICKVCGKPIIGRGKKTVCDVCKAAEDIAATV